MCREVSLMYYSNEHEKASIRSQYYGAGQWLPPGALKLHNNGFLILCLDILDPSSPKKTPCPPPEGYLDRVVSIDGRPGRAFFVRFWCGLESSLQHFNDYSGFICDKPRHLQRSHEIGGLGAPNVDDSQQCGEYKDHFRAWKEYGRFRDEMRQRNKETLAARMAMHRTPYPNVFRPSPLKHDKLADNSLESSQNQKDCKQTSTYHVNVHPRVAENERDDSQRDIECTIVAVPCETAPILDDTEYIIVKAEDEEWVNVVHNKRQLDAIPTF